MNPFVTRLVCATVLGLASTFACRADSIASSASSAGSASVGSISDSIHGSSNSSSGDKKVADGDYQVLEVADIPERPGMLRVRLEAHRTGAGETTALLLDLPLRALEQRRLRPGDIVSVHNRPYGLEFARAQSGEAFFLVLSDEWRSDLDARAVRF